MIVNIRNKGASLLEVLIATAIFSIAFLSFISVQINSLETVRDGYVKKLITDSSNDFTLQTNLDLASQKSLSAKNEILELYSNSNWNITASNCPSSGSHISNCYKNDELDDSSICTTKERIQLTTENFQCNLIQNVPSAKTSFGPCNDNTNLYCLIVVGIILLILILHVKKLIVVVCYLRYCHD